MSWLDRFRPYPQLRQVIVNLKSGTAFRALIWRRSGPFLVLREVEMLSDRDSQDAAAGHQWRGFGAAGGRGFYTGTMTWQ
jgi:hypothetical protein